MHSRCKPIQWIGSFEGFINDIHSHDEILTSCRPTSYDLSDFKQRVRDRLERLKDVGIGGVVVNVGYEDYLDSEAGWHRFVSGIGIAAELGLRIWIFDDKGYPSGTAGGKVLQGHPELEAMGLKKMTVEMPQPSPSVDLPDRRAKVFCVYGVHSDGPLQQLPAEKGSRSVTIPSDGFSTVDVYFLAPLFEGTHAVWNMAATRRYINVLERPAVNRFLNLTYVKYFEKIPADLRSSVEAFFNDETSLMAYIGPNVTRDTVEEDPVNTDLPLFPAVPWCTDMETEFFGDHGYSLADHVPDLFSGQSEQPRKVRRDFWSTVSRLYASSFSEQAANVCEALGIDFAGHLLAEETILDQAVLHADLIQVLKNFHRPGLDLLTCTLDRFPKSLLPHKCALSAAFWGSRRGVMSETSDYMEAWQGDRSGASVQDIKCVLALQYLLGVRDFVFMFLISNFSSEEYRDICDFTTRMVQLGAGKAYMPQGALYYPMEYVWERYTPTPPPAQVSGGAGQLSAELEEFSQLTTETVNRLFYANAQFVLCGRRDIACLPRRGITELVCYGPGEPEPDLVRMSEDVGVEPLTLADFEVRYQEKAQYTTGSHVVYATYGGFAFAVNYGQEPSSISFPGSAEAVFPLAGTERRTVSGTVELKPYKCVFLFSLPREQSENI